MKTFRFADKRRNVEIMNFFFTRWRFNFYDMCHVSSRAPYSDETDCSMYEFANVPRPSGINCALAVRQQRGGELLHKFTVARPIPERMA